MSHYQIAVVVGSLRQDSYNRKLAQAMMHMGPADFAFRFADIGDLPLYNQDDDGHPHEAVRRFKQEIASAQGLLFLTPEYNRSIPGVLKNALDHASRPYGESVWFEKPAGIGGASPGTLGTALAQEHLRNILSHLGVPTLCLPELYVHVTEELFDAAGGIAEERTRRHLEKWMVQYAAWIRTWSGAAKG